MPYRVDEDLWHVYIVFKQVEANRVGVLGQFPTKQSLPPTVPPTVPPGQLPETISPTPRAIPSPDNSCTDTFPWTIPTQVNSKFYGGACYLRGKSYGWELCGVGKVRGKCLVGLVPGEIVRKRGLGIVRGVVWSQLQGWWVV